MNHFSLAICNLHVFPQWKPYIDNYLKWNLCLRISILKGLVEEFGAPKNQREGTNQVALQSSWLFGNGMFALVLSFGLLFTGLQSRKARSWRYGSGIDYTSELCFWIMLWKSSTEFKLHYKIDHMFGITLDKLVYMSSNVNSNAFVWFIFAVK